jgi:hypothetical protein
MRLGGDEGERCHGKYRALASKFHIGHWLTSKKHQVDCTQYLGERNFCAIKRKVSWFNLLQEIMVGS